MARSSRAAAFALLLLLAAAPVAAQQVTLSGIVRDAISGAPVGGALVTHDGSGRRAFANTQGRFQLSGIPTGNQRLRVERLGYQTVELTVSVTDPPTLLEVSMAVDPVALEGLTVTGDARAALGGVVLNARSGEPVPWTDLTLTRDAVQQVGRREAADEQGVFSISNITVGTYLLRVERLGFESQYVPVSHTAPGLPLEVRLEPDSAVLKGLAVMVGEMGLRRASFGSVTRAFGEERLRYSASPGMLHFLEHDAFLAIVPCGNTDVRGNCVELRGARSPVHVFIDELPVLGGNPLEALNVYRPGDFYHVEYFQCRGLEIHAFTYSYMERMARRPRILIPPCTP